MTDRPPTPSPSLWQRLTQGHFLRSVMVMMSGTAAAQAVLILTTPVLSRLYSPEAFGTLGVFLSVVGCIAVVGCGRYEMAIVLPRRATAAGAVVCLCLAILGGMVLLSVVLVALLGRPVAWLLDEPSLRPLLWWVPITVLAMGLYQILNFWASRQRQFKRLAASRLTQNTTQVATQAALGWWPVVASGLVLGQIVGQIVSSAVLLLQMPGRERSTLLRQFQRRRMWAMFRRHRAFLYFGSPQALLNQVSQNVPVLMLASLFGHAVAGHYWFAFRLLRLPSNLVGDSFRQVFYQRASELYSQGGDIGPLFRRATLWLGLIYLGPLIILLAIGPWLFSVAMGPQWVTAGQYTRWLAIWWFFGFINVPAVMLVPILNLQRAHLVMDVLVMLARIACILLGYASGSAMATIIAFSLVGAAFNGSIIGYIYLQIVRRRHLAGAVGVQVAAPAASGAAS